MALVNELAELGLGALTPLRESEAFSWSGASLQACGADYKFNFFIANPLLIVFFR
jgi:hypothetical protein